MLRLVDWFAVDEPVELRPPVVNIQARGAKDITIGNLRSSREPPTPINFRRYVYDSFGEKLAGLPGPRPN
jgi:hypothetical protein